MTGTATPQELFTAARDHLALGRSLLPVGQNKRPHGQALISTGHTAPADGGVKGAWQALQTTPATEDQIWTWLAPGWRGLGLITGAISGVIVIDVDKGEGVERFQDWGLTSRAHVRTRSGGLHWYLKHPGWSVKTVQSQSNKRLESIRGIDLRGDGGYVVLPPTRFEQAQYTALRHHGDLDPVTLLPADVQVLLGLDAPPAPAPAVPAAPRVGHVRTWSRADGTSLDQELLFRALDMAITGGKRNESGFWLACQLRDNGFSEADAQDVMERYAYQVPDYNSKGDREAYTLQEARHSLGQAYRREARSAWIPPRPPVIVTTPLQRLQDMWNALSAEDRIQAARCVAGAKGAVRDEGILLLAYLGMPGVQDLVQEVEDARRLGTAVPGLNGLVKLLDRWMPGHVNT